MQTSESSAMPAADAAPAFYTAVASNGCALAQYSASTEEGVIFNVLSVARNEGFKGSGLDRLIELGWVVRPVYTNPMQHGIAAAPQAVQAATESVLIDGAAYEVHAEVAAELLRLHIELHQASAWPIDGFPAPDLLIDADIDADAPYPAYSAGLVESVVRPYLASKKSTAPLPLLVRDIARDLGITVPQACIALKPLGNYSTNSAVTAEMARMLRDHFPAPAHPAEGVPVPMPVAHPHHCTARTADGSCEECEGHAQAMAEWNAERTAQAATQPAAQGMDDRDVFEHEYAQHAIDYAGIDSTCEEVAKRVKDGRDGNSYKHTHESGAWVGWQLALAAQAKQGEQENG